MEALGEEMRAQRVSVSTRQSPSAGFIINKKLALTTELIVIRFLHNYHPAKNKSLAARHTSISTNPYSLTLLYSQENRPTLPR